MTANDYWGVLIITINFLVFGYFVAINTTYLALFIAAFVSAGRYVRRKRLVDLDELFRSPLTPKVSVIIPAYNEAAGIVESVRAALMLKYPRFEVVAVNDGSTDATIAALVLAYDLRQVTKVVERPVPCADIVGVYISTVHDNLIVIDKEHGGKADTLNAGINVSRGDIIVTVDADSLIEPDALLKIARPFLERPGETVAVGGVVRVLNGCTVREGHVTEVRLPHGFWANVQIIEYLRAFLGARMGWATINSLLVVPGAFGAFDRDALIQVGGYNRDTVGEDMELIMRMHQYFRKARRKYHIWFIPDPVCWTQVPVKIKQVASQRDRWQRGMIESLRAHETMLFNPVYGTVGMLSMPFYFFFEMLGPVVELLGYAVIVLAQAFGFLGLKFLWLFLSVAVLYGIIVSLLGIALEGVALQHFPRVRSLAKMTFYAVLENLGYRQVNTWWRTKAYVTYYTRKTKWGDMERQAYSGASPSPDKEPIA
ncbi:MAG TPA: glycosyltransferase [Candidatus Anoxymicrobiaceae bacterium]